MANKAYLGDSVYAEFDGYHIILTTDNDDGPSNTIAVEPEVLTMLINYAKGVMPGLPAIQSHSDNSA